MEKIDKDILIKVKAIRGLHDFFAKTKYGKKLFKEIRYARYKPNDMTNQDWIDLLGPDVNNLEHNLVTYCIVRDFIRQSRDFVRNQFHESNMSAEDFSKIVPDFLRFTADEEIDLLLAAMIHDWGEAIVGDITYGSKTEDFKDNEMKELHALILEIFKKYHNGIFVDRVDGVINDIVSEKSTKLGSIFDAVENLGYFETALRSWEKSEENQEIAINLQWISVNVLLYNMPILLDYAQKFPPVFNFLEENQEKITEIFEYVQETVFDKYEKGEQEEKKKMFNSAREKWFSYI